MKRSFRRFSTWGRQIQRQIKKRGGGGGGERYTTTTHPLQFLVESIHDISFNDSKFLFKHFKGAVIHDWMFFSSCKKHMQQPDS